MYIDIKKRNRFDECTKKEFMLSINDFETTTTVEGVISFCLAVQTLIIMEPGTYINHPEMGVGIRGYRFEYLDSITLNTLKTAIQDQINTYIPNDLITVIDVQKLKDESTGKENTIGVYLKLSKKTKEIPDDVVLTFQAVGKSKILSELYI